MISAYLILALALVGWISVIILVHAALQKPRIGVLTERAIIGVVLALFVTVRGVVTLGTDQNTFDAEPLLRVFILVLGLIPVYWVWLYLTGRLGDGSK